MELLFLGTSSGTPTKNRNVSGIAVREINSKNWCLVDCGEGTQHRILNTNLSLNNLQAILITHVHGDHCYGLPGLLGSAAMSGRTKRLYIVGPPEIEKMMLSVRENTQLMLPYELMFINVLDLQSSALETEFDIGRVELSHRAPSYAYTFTSKIRDRKLDIDKLKKENIKPGPIWGELQQGKNAKTQEGKSIIAEDFLLKAPDPLKIIVAGDNDKPDLLFDEARNANVLVHEATYTHDYESG